MSNHGRYPHIRVTECTHTHPFEQRWYTCKFTLGGRHWRIFFNGLKPRLNSIFTWIKRCKLAVRVSCRMHCISWKDGHINCQSIDTSTCHVYSDKLWHSHSVLIRNNKGIETSKKWKRSSSIGQQFRLWFTYKTSLVFTLFLAGGFKFYKHICWIYPPPAWNRGIHESFFLLTGFPSWWWRWARSKIYTSWN